jgi:hypothetical protein
VILAQTRRKDNGSLSDFRRFKQKLQLLSSASLGDLRELRSILTRDFGRVRASYHPRVCLIQYHKHTSSPECITSETLNMCNVYCFLKITTFLHLNYSFYFQNDSKTCAYWKPRLGENRWKTDGCKRVTDKLYSNRLICECDHLTAFAVMDISRTMVRF